MKFRTLHSLLFLLLVTTFGLHAQIPERPNPPRLVNDLAGILGPQAEPMERQLEAFARETSNQIVVVTVNDLGDYDPAEFAYTLGDKWGVGGKKNDNGVVVLIKPKTDTRGQVFIATGRGLEGALPDVVCKRIINRRMLPSFRRGDYATGVNNALTVIMARAKDEYNEKVNPEKDGLSAGQIIFIIFVIVVVAIVLISNLGSKSGDNDRNSGTWGGGGPIIFPPIGGFGSGRSSGFGSGGFGGFGGFGGGSFGGGGAGGSW